MQCTISLPTISSINQVSNPAQLKCRKENYDSGFHDETDSFLWQRLGSSAEESIAAGGQLCFNDNDLNNFTLDLSPKTKL